MLAVLDNLFLALLVHDSCVIGARIGTYLRTQRELHRLMRNLGI